MPEGNAGAKILGQKPQQVFKAQEGDPRGRKSQLGEIGTERWWVGQRVLDLGPCRNGGHEASVN